MILPYRFLFFYCDLFSKMKVRDRFIVHKRSFHSTKVREIFAGAQEPTLKSHFYHFSFLRLKTHQKKERVRDIDEIDIAQNQYQLESVALLDSHPKHFSLAHLNTQSMTPSFTQFESMLTQHQFDLITMSETLLKQNKALVDHLEIEG